MANTFSDNPQANHTLAQDQPNIRANFNYLVDTLGTQTKSGDHQISTGGVDTNAFEGRHLQVSLKNRSGGAPTVAGLGDSVDSLLYSSNGNVFFGSVTGAGAFQLTTYSAAANFGLNTNNYTPQSGGGPVGVNYTAGWTFLPGGLLFQYGFVSVSSTGNKIVKFPATFSSSVYNIILTPTTTSTPSNNVYVQSGTISTTQFTCNNQSGSINGFYWTAIGI